MMRNSFIGLILLLLSGCVTTEYIEIKPECEVPPLPELPHPDMSELPDEQRLKAREREDLLYGWAEEMEDQLKTLCKPPE